MRRFSATLGFGMALLLMLPAAARAHDPGHRHRHHHDGGDESYDRHGDRDARRRPAHPRRDRWLGLAEQPRRGGAQLGLGAGYFAPWQGDGGEQLQLEVLARSDGGHVRWGIEALHQDFETRVFDVDNVDVDAWRVNLVAHYVANPGGLTPYIGAGMGLHINDFSSKDIQQGSGLLVRDDTGIGWGVFGVVGVEAPLSERVSLFAEGRLQLAGQATGVNADDGTAFAELAHRGIDDHDLESLGGGSGVVGLRFEF